MFVVEYNKQFEDKKIFELSKRVSIDEALEKIIAVNPCFVTIFPILQREYTLDGCKKNEED